jgi:hypothetical protein
MASHDANVDDEDLTIHACCAPITNLARPIDFSELEYVRLVRENFMNEVAYSLCL